VLFAPKFDVPLGVITVIEIIFVTDHDDTAAKRTGDGDGAKAENS
jgi:hypothetical protein